MKKKIISIIIVGMFLLTNLTIFSAAGIKTLSKNNNEVNNLAENNYSNRIGEIELHVHVMEPTKRIDINLNIEEGDIISPGVYTFTYRVIFHELPEGYSIDYMYWNVILKKDHTTELSENNDDKIEYSYNDVPPDTIEDTVEINIAKKPRFPKIEVKAHFVGRACIDGIYHHTINEEDWDSTEPIVINSRALNTKFPFLTILGQFLPLQKLIQKLPAFLQ